MEYSDRRLPTMMISKRSLFLKYLICIDAIALDYRVNLLVLYLLDSESSQNSIVSRWKQCVLSICLEARRSDANASSVRRDISMSALSQLAAISQCPVNVPRKRTFTGRAG